MNTLQNKLWPNTDGNLGKIKVQIPAGTADDPWPEGDALVGNFVYKNGKLVGFIDTAALIPNESGETTIPYDTINTKFPGILKDTFIINAGERCKYQLAKLEEDIAVYTSTRLFEIMDADKFKVSYDKDENKVTVAVSLDTTAAQIAEVESLLDRVLPSNLVTEISEVPMGFRRLEWIQNPGKAYIDTGLKMSSEYEIEAEVDYTEYHTGQNALLMTNWDVDNYSCYNLILGNYNMMRFDYGNTILNQYIGSQEGAGKKWLISTSKNKITLQVPELSLSPTWTTNESTFITKDNACLFSLRGSWPFNGRFLSIRGSEGGAPRFDFIPAIDEAAGAPCLFDKVTRKPFYNYGTGDFTYPGAEQAIQTLDLDFEAKNYAQLTEHGVRRLYHVPKGYTGTKDDYAAANGFKLLVETPLPEEGYWAPVWHDREDCIELEWMETEPPAEEI